MKDQWDELRTVFDSAWPLPPEERARLLDERCDGNPRFRRELEKLLAAHDRQASADSVSHAGRRLGGWLTSELVGRGGMAEVYLANRVDGHLEQRGALKVLPRHLLSWDYLDRFRREGEILARLEHPNIARLLDGGVSDNGDPFLVMEFVDGRRIDEYCDSQHLPIRRRLEIFLDLCSAVESAHHSLVLHRDIKPSNVMVTPTGAVKLLDFGTARLIDGSGLETMAPLTPSFASPEQLRGEPVTTLSDVYGLGMTLYRILAGTLPFGGTSPSAYQTVQDAVERLPPAPSEAPSVDRSLGRELRGDLDNIVLKAIDRDPARRYSSAARLADDIRRYLERRPVEARAGTWTYRAARFAARNRIGVLLAGLLCVTVLVAAVALAVQNRQARLEAARSRHLADFLTRMMGLRYDTESGPLRAEGVSARAVDVLRYAGDNLEREFTGLPLLEARLRADLGHALAELGYTDEAAPILRRGLALANSSRDPALAAEIAGYLARTDYIEGDFHKSEDGFAEATRLLRSAPGPIPAAAESLLLINASATLSTLHGPTPEAARMIDRAVSLGREVGERSAAFALALANHGVLLWDRGRFDEGEREIRRAMAIHTAMSPRPIDACLVSVVLAGRIMRRARLDEAARLLADSHDCVERSFKPGSMIPSVARLSELELEFRQGKGREIVAPLRAFEQDLARSLPKAAWLHGELLELRGAAACGSGSRITAIPDLNRAVELLSPVFGADSNAAKTASALARQCSTQP